MGPYFVIINTLTKRSIFLGKTRWIVFSVIVVGFLTLLIVFSGGSRTDVNNIDTAAIQKASDQNGQIADHVFGKIGSKVTLIEYGDYQCPPCGNIFPVVKSITNQYKNQLQYVFRNFPIPELHPNAKAAAAVAEAAGLQDRYWEMHDKLYETQADWSDLSVADRLKYFDKIAGEVGLDVKKFDTDLLKKSIGEKISFDIALGSKAGVDATPTFFLNGVKLDTSAYSSESQFKKTIDTALKKAGIALPK